MAATINRRGWSLIQREASCCKGYIALGLSPQMSGNGAQNRQSETTIYGNFNLPLSLSLKVSLPTSDKSHFTPEQNGPREISEKINYYKTFTEYMK